MLEGRLSSYMTNLEALPQAEIPRGHSESPVAEHLTQGCSAFGGIDSMRVDRLNAGASEDSIEILADRAVEAAHDAHHGKIGWLGEFVSIKSSEKKEKCVIDSQEDKNSLKAGLGKGDRETAPPAFMNLRREDHAALKVKSEKVSLAPL